MDNFWRKKDKKLHSWDPVMIFTNLPNQEVMEINYPIAVFVFPSLSGNEKEWRL